MSFRILPALALCATLAACQDRPATTPPAETDHTAHASHQQAHGGLHLDAVWARASVPGAATGAAYLTITNHGEQADTLLSAATPLAGRVEIHQTLIEDGIAKMRPASDLAIAPGGTLKAEPGGLHLMLMDLQAPLLEGEAVPLTLTFQHGGDITVQLVPRSATEAGPPSAHDHH